MLFAVSVIIKRVFIKFKGHSARLDHFLLDIKNSTFLVKWN